MNSEIIKVGFVQFDVRLAEIDTNLESAIHGLDTLGRQSVDVAVLPEMWSCGFDNENLPIHARRTPEIIDRISETASRNRMIIAGSLPEISDGKIYNTLYLIDKDGSVAGAYRKIHLFTLTNEERFFDAGKEIVVCETSIGGIGLMTCYDLRFPELCRSLALKGAGLVVVPAQWPRVRIEHWDVLLRARAIENQLFVAAANRVGRDMILTYGGHSQVVAPRGKALVKAENGAAFQWAEIDFKEMVKFRKRMACLEERAPETYEL